MPVARLYSTPGAAELIPLLQALADRCFGKPLLAVATTTTRVKTTNQVDYAANGALARKAAADPVDDFDGAFTNTGASQFCKVRVEINAAGTVTGVQGPIAASQAAAVMPRRTPGLATLGWIEIPASFTFGTTSYGSAAFFDGDPDLSDGRGFPPGDRGISRDIYNGP